MERKAVSGIATEYMGGLCLRWTFGGVIHRNRGVSAKCAVLLSRKCTVHVQLRRFRGERGREDCSTADFVSPHSVRMRN
jgi:hypothetical protein